MRHYCGSFGYEALCSCTFRFKAYADTVMKMTRRKFLKLANRVPGTDKYRNMVQHYSWKAQATFSAICYVKNGMCLSVDKLPQGEKMRKEKNSNVEFYQTESRSSVKSFRLCNLLAVRALRSVECGEELFSDQVNS